jgi:phosphoribosylformimino-5-aminoimidazole carboxamide ribonucleotide (ProFAR) isomerase
MIIPCIDLMDAKVVQLVQGRDKALEGDAPLEMLRKFAAFPEIQVIDLDAAMGKGENAALVELLAERARCRVGGGDGCARSCGRSNGGPAGRLGGLRQDARRHGM